MNNKYTFGPVPSRRLGFSLGVDLIPLKTCTYNCVYCQLFQTSTQTLVRQSFFNKGEIISEIRDVVSKRGSIDYITFSGSGEPTLNSDLGSIIKAVKEIANIPVCVITNSSTLWMEDVRKDLELADLVLPSCDAVTDEVWNKINRPIENLNVKTVLEGLKTFCANHKGKKWLEVMFVRGINDSPDEIQQIADFVNSLNIDKVQINTVVRPPNEPDSEPLTREELEKIVSYFKHKTEIIASFNKVATTSRIEDVSEVILELLSRRPCKPQEMADSLGLNLNEVAKYLEKLQNEQKIVCKDSGHFALHH